MEENDTGKGLSIQRDWPREAKAVGAEEPEALLGGLTRRWPRRYLLRLMSPDDILTELATTCPGKLILTWAGPNVLYAADVVALPIELPGVYVLSAFTPASSTLVPFYVGQSRCLRRRLGEHLAGTRTFARVLRAVLPTYFSIAAVSERWMRNAAEAALIRRLSPAGNDVLPRAVQVTVNVPSLSLVDP